MFIAITKFAIEKAYNAGIANNGTIVAFFITSGIIGIGNPINAINPYNNTLTKSNHFTLFSCDVRRLLFLISLLPS